MTGVSDADDPVSDDSPDRGDPDPDGDGDSSEGDPTVIVFDLPPIENPTLGAWGLMVLVLVSLRRLRRARECAHRFGESDRVGTAARSEAPGVLGKDRTEAGRSSRATHTKDGMGAAPLAMGRWGCPILGGVAQRGRGG